MASDEARLERMRRTWQAAAADPAEVADAYARYRRRAAKPRPRSSFFEFGLGFAAVGLALLLLHVGGLLGDGAPPRTAEHRPARPPALAPAVTAAAPARAERLAGATQVPSPSAASSVAALVASGAALASAYAAVIERDGVVTAIEPFVPHVVAAGERVVVRLGHEVHTIEGPRLLEFRLDPGRASGWRMTQLDEPPGPPAMPKRAPATESLEAPPARAPEPSRPRVGAAFEEALEAPDEGEAAQASWARAALALRNGDAARAEAALVELSKTESAGTRDAAGLSLAQVYLSQGRRAEARALLQRLSAEGATPFVRRRANELLGR